MSPTDDERRREKRIRRRTIRLDNQFAFASPGGSDAESNALYTRGEAEQRASTLLAPLPALPAMVLEASKPAGPGTSGLENAIEVDSRLASLTLTLGGTGFFLRGGEVPGNLMQLIDRAGTVAFRNMTLVAFLHGLFVEPLPWYGYDEHGLWRHLLATAIAAWKIGDAVGFHRIACEQVFFASLLHDIGKPTIQGLMGKDAPRAQDASMGGQLTALETELRTVNMTHPELVPLMLDIWGVEHDVFGVAEHHHAPQRAGNKAVQASIVQLADLIANRASVGLTGSYGFSAFPLDRVAPKLNVSESKCAELMDDLGWTVAEIAAEIESM